MIHTRNFSFILFINFRAYQFKDFGQSKSTFIINW